MTDTSDMFTVSHFRRNSHITQTDTNLIRNLKRQWLPNITVMQKRQASQDRSGSILYEVTSEGVSKFEVVTQQRTTSVIQTLNRVAIETDGVSLAPNMTMCNSSVFHISTSETLQTKPNPAVSPTLDDNAENTKQTNSDSWAFDSDSEFTSEKQLKRAVTEARYLSRFESQTDDTGFSPDFLVRRAAAHERHALEYEPVTIKSGIPTRAGTILPEKIRRHSPRMDPYIYLHKFPLKLLTACVHAGGLPEADTVFELDMTTETYRVRPD